MGADFRRRIFPSSRLNLNPSTLGTPSILVQEASENFFKGEKQSYPLELYSSGRKALKEVRSIATEIWGREKHRICITHSSSQLQNLLLLNIVLNFYQEKKKLPFKVMTTSHEHYGGVGFFLRRPDMQTFFLKENEIIDLRSFERIVKNIKPDIFFASHVSYDKAKIFPIEDWFSILKKENKECITILDLAQSFALLKVSLTQDVDFAFSSSHKWLFGPYGLGFFWIHIQRIDYLKALYWNGERLDREHGLSPFEIAGGQNFAKYASLKAALELYRKITRDVIFKRSCNLAAYLAAKLFKYFEKYRIKAKFYGVNGMISQDTIEDPSQYCGFFSVDLKDLDAYPIYQALNQNEIHIKCIKKNTLNILRFGTPYYETEERLEKVIQEISKLCSA